MGLWKQCIITSGANTGLDRFSCTLNVQGTICHKNRFAHGFVVLILVWYEFIIKEIMLYIHPYFECLFFSLALGKLFDWCSFTQFHTTWRLLLLTEISQANIYIKAWISNYIHIQRGWTYPNFNGSLVMSPFKFDNNNIRFSGWAVLVSTCTKSSSTCAHKLLDTEMHINHIMSLWYFL